MSGHERFFGPVLNDVNQEAAYDGLKQEERMALVRRLICEVRSQWADEEKYNTFRNDVRRFIKTTTHSPQFWSLMGEMLSGFNDHADMVIDRNADATTEKCSAIQIYCSEDGYNFLYGVVTQVLRTEDVDMSSLRTAVVLAELLTIELYNLRLANLQTKGIPISREWFTEAWL